MAKSRSGQAAWFSEQEPAFRDALRIEIAALQAEDDGDVQAIREVADRLDGKVAQAITGDDELPPVSMIITGVVRAGDNQD